ncbi:BnaCnng70930D [Brassica napus]|uniref:(rape) hypothetical protein n=1 Tax=Brassica napus TaxID=3708 RepID=A0A078JZK5_BRANA|nr:unnamed protein product [Brassica napus]CDY71021.1 BnaCnng70930D [Brassica napus]
MDSYQYLQKNSSSSCNNFFSLELALPSRKSILLLLFLILCLCFLLL